MIVVQRAITGIEPQNWPTRKLGYRQKFKQVL